MKKILFFLFLPIVAFSQNQKFILTPIGLRDSSDSIKDFLVIDIPGKTAKQLYDASINFINETYNTPDVAIKGKIDSEYLRHEGFVKSISTVTARSSVVKYQYNISSTYSIELRFKNGK